MISSECYLERFLRARLYYICYMSKLLQRTSTLSYKENTAQFQRKTLVE